MAGNRGRRKNRDTVGRFTAKEDFLRFVAASILALTALFVAAPIASAHGVRPKGVLLTKNVAVKGLTGSCGCLDQWYTLQVEPGKVQLQARMTQLGRVPSGSYGILMYLFKGSTKLKLAEFGCLVHHKCSGVATLTYRTSKAAVLYVRVSGPGALSLNYRLVAKGSIGRLHCGAYC